MFNLKAKMYSNHFKNFGDKEIEEFAFRLSRHIKNAHQKGANIDTNLVLRGFFILDEIENKRVPEDVFDFSKTRQKYIRKYAVEIYEMYLQGETFDFISSEIFINHKVNISKTAIKNFCVITKKFRKGNER